MTEKTELIMRFTKIKDDLDFFISHVASKKYTFELIPKTTVKVGHTTYLEIGEHGAS